MLLSIQFQSGSDKASDILVRSIRKSLLFSGDVWHRSNERTTLLFSAKIATGEMVRWTENVVMNNAVRTCGAEIK